MNQLPLETRKQIINLLVEGSSLRSASRITGTSINTVSKLLVDVGKACQRFHNETVINVASQKVQCDEIWSFVYAKEKNKPQDREEKCGDVWTWTGIDADTKLVISWLVGDRNAETANVFMQDIADRLKDRVQLTADGFHAYLEAVKGAFGNDIDFAQLIKIYDFDYQTARRYTPMGHIGSKKKTITGNPNKKDISTSYIERQNLTMRMHMRRFTRLTNAFSKKVENHCYAIALHFVYYNFAKIHTTLRVTPAMEAKLMDDVMSIEQIVLLTDKYSNLISQ